MSSNRVAFYITGATYKKEKKLLGCPETEDGTGAAEAKVVTDLLTEWELKPEICGMVFDTTSSNTGAEIGACKLVEDWLERPILWCGCRHHVYELHLKMKLLKNMFKMSQEEQEQVEEIIKFVLIFFVKSWFKSPLSTSAAQSDLTFMANMMRYRKVTKPRYILAVMQSCNHHLWYLIPQLVLLALADPDLPDNEKEKMAAKLHSLERTEVSSGKPEFPFIDWSGEEIVTPDMSSFVTSASWLIFDLLGLSGSQDWLTIPANLWHNFIEFRELKEFAENIAV